MSIYYDHINGSFFDETGLVAYYKFEGNLKDTRGNYDQTNTATAITFEKGRYSTTGKFQNAGTYTNSNLGIDGGSITISSWVKFASFSSMNYNFIFSVESSNNKIGYFTGYSAVNVLFFGREKKPNNWDAYTAAGAVPALTLNTWYNFVGIYDGTNLSLYNNGTIIQSPVPASGNGTGPTPDKCGIGNNYGVNNNNYNFNGDIDELLIFNRAWSATEVLDYYKTRGRHRNAIGHATMQ